MICPKCNYNWLIRTPNPKRCPRCMYRLERSKAPILVSEPQANEPSKEVIELNQPSEKPIIKFKPRFRLELD